MHNHPARFYRTQENALSPSSWQEWDPETLSPIRAWSATPKLANPYSSSPPPRAMPSFALSETDTRFLDFGPYLSPLSDPISSILSVAVTMRDSTAVPVSGPAVLQAPESAAPFAMPPWIDPTGFVVSFWVDSGGVPGNYRFTVSVMTAAGRTIDRYALVSVLDAIG